MIHRFFTIAHMEALTETQVRRSFVNCSRGEVARATLPDGFDELRWDDLDFLGWIDPKAPLHGYLVVPTVEHGLVGLRLRRNTTGPVTRRSRMCSLCTTTHSGGGVSLMVAPRAGRSGRDGNTVGLDICTGLECSAYARGTLPLPAASAVHETLSVEDRVDRLMRNVSAFVGRALRPAQ
jgi:hypothetical protein